MSQETVVILNKEEKCAIAKKNGQVNDKGRDRDPVVNCPEPRKPVSKKGAVLLLDHMVGFASGEELFQSLLSKSSPH